MSQEQDQKTMPRRLPWKGVGFFLTLCGFIILIAAFYFAFHTLSNVNMGLSKALLHLQQNYGNLQIKLDQVQEESQQSSNELKQTVTELRQIQGSNQTTWRIQQAQYYVKLADTNLRFEDNVPVALQLLQTADEEVRNLNDAKLDPIRKALAQDMTALQSVPNVDRTGIYMRLSALNDQVEKLPMLTQHAEANAATTLPNTEVWWKRGLQETWQALQKIVIVRYSANGVPPLVTPEQHDFLMLNLHAILEKAMWAVLNKQPDVYRASLQQASVWIKKYFAADSAVTQSMLSNLAQLQEIDIHPVTPAMTASLQAFHDYLVSVQH